MLSHHNQKIDFLRGIAILSVLVLHFNLAYHIDQSALADVFSVNFINLVGHNGNYGVVMFFVISGFLITTTSLERYGSAAKIKLRGFYVFRFARIMPCLLLALLVISILNWVRIPIFENSPGSTSFFMGILSVLTFWHNVLMAKIGYFNYCLNIYWSLSVEEVFYLFFPLLCLLLKRMRYLVVVCIVLIIVGPIYRSFYTQNEIVALYGYLSCFDAIAIGCCAAMIAQKVKLKGHVGKAMQIGAVLLLIGVYLYSNIMSNVVIGVTLFAIATAVLLVYDNSHDVVSAKAMRPPGRMVCWFGRNSYELYLFHIIILASMKTLVSPAVLGNVTKLLWMALFFGLSVLVAEGISKFYSVPMNKKLRAALK